MRHDEPIDRNDSERATFVAVGDLVLWPQSVGDRAVTTREADTWPAFALVVGERRDLLGSRARVLFDLLENTRQSPEALVVSGRSRWTVVDPVKALFRLRLHIESPPAFDLDVLVPARRLVGLLHAVARGAPIGLTTNRHIRELGSTVDIRQVLQHVVVVRCPPVPGLAELADELLWTMAPGHRRL
ncbi:hypothetical protein [Actinophytocola glycyrrhizae]|uniref:Uncharacterized protein n=1 Tax=Actinophytocola glycyrrhizae TaxID=2044873 RepID=A0ABV9SAR0_9PSEU